MRKLSIGTLLFACVLEARPACRIESFAAGPVTPLATAVAKANAAVLGPIRRATAYPDIPSVSTLHLPKDPPQKIVESNAYLSSGLCDPYLEEARELKIFPDFKLLCDARPKGLSHARRGELLNQAREAELKGGRTEYLRAYIDGAYEFSDETTPGTGLIEPQWKIQTGDAAVDSAFAYTEKVLPTLVRRTPAVSGGSLLPTPYPILIAAPGRFRESYYWDTYFGLKGVLATGRLALAQMQAENLLEEVRRYGFVPNGTRDYYLSRSQPPLLSSLVRDVYEATPGGQKKVEWLRRRAYPLMKQDYLGFWMKAGTRYDSASGLNHDWDALDLPRPERHGFDDEKVLGKTYRDVRAAAESGLDFTQGMQGEASQIAGVLLNALLFKTEIDLKWAASELGLKSDVDFFMQAATKRRAAIDRYLWNPARGEYDNYHLEKKTSVALLTAAAFAPLFAGAASSAQAQSMRGKLAQLEKPGGLMASVSTASTYQWDGNNGWAPLQMLAIEGLRKYGFESDAKRLATKWVQAVAQVHHKTGLMFERLDVAKVDYPEADKTKYPTQTGFLWTNSSYVWALVEVLGTKLVSADSGQ